MLECAYCNKYFKPTETESGSSLLDLSDLTDLAELLIVKNWNILQLELPMHKFPSEGLNLINTPTPNHFSLTFEFHKSLQQKDLITFRIVFICEDITFTIQKSSSIV